jgi:hypothetical protein
MGSTDGVPFKSFFSLDAHALRKSREQDKTRIVANVRILFISEPPSPSPHVCDAEKGDILG